ncbi:hypothetical protein ACSBR1_001129 [Camellia fascicularis]
MEIFRVIWVLVLPILSNFIWVNHFRGSIPESLFNASRIQVLDLSTNQFQGSIPLLRNMNRLIHLNLVPNTQFQPSGGLPASLANLSAALIHFCISDNLFTGSFPIGIEKFQNLISMSIEKNLFTGLLPHSIGHFTNYNICLYTKTSSLVKFRCLWQSRRAFSAHNGSKPVLRKNSH